MTINVKSDVSLLFGRIKNGDQNALVQLFNVVDQCIYNIAFGILNDHGFAEDVLIETFESFVKNIDKIINPIAAYDWLKVTARNKALNIYYKRKREVVMEEEVLEYSVNKNNYVAATLDDKLIMNEALATLSENERMAIIYKSKKYTFGEIAELLNVKVGKLRGLIDKAQNKLKKFFKDF